MSVPDKPQINLSTYHWSIRLFKLLRRLARVNVSLHQKEGQIEQGEIFLFNHFARFETFIPQFLIYQETGDLCRSVAAPDFFTEDNPFSNYLLSVGAIPNTHPRLFPLLAVDVLRGRKIIVFPEGGMVKDRRVLDQKGRYAIYSRSAGESRKHHSGAAVLALVVDLLKGLLLKLENTGQQERIEAWAQSLGMEDIDTLLAAARRPTLIVPANITFYPIRVDDNLLRKGAELLAKGLSRSLTEELLIEGNLLLKDTDMDIRLADAIRASDYWRWWQSKLIHRLARDMHSLDTLFALSSGRTGWNAKILKWGVRFKARELRDTCMHRMYSAVTVNLSHLASQVILSFLDRHHTEVDQSLFDRTLYLAVKKLQKTPLVHRHRSLENPEGYTGILDGECPGFEQFLKTTSSMNLIRREGCLYRFLPKLGEEHALDEIRIENLVVVYANEVAPVAAVAELVRESIREAPSATDQTLARLRFDDELLAYRYDGKRFDQPEYQDINRQETATESGEPFLLNADRAHDIGIVLAHGFLASPAEVRSFGEKLAKLGYPVLGVRLKGHGTSPWDLRERSWEEWLASLRRGHAIMSAFAERVCLIGFSTGGTLALRLAAEAPGGLAGVAAICAALKIKDRRMPLVPVLHKANRLARWLPSFEGVMPFRARESDHPHINYHHVPIRGVYELQRLIEDLEGHLAEVQCPVCLIQATEDPVVDPRSAELIYEKLGSREKDLVAISAAQHGILSEDIGETHKTVIDFLETLLPK